MRGGLRFAIRFGLTVFDAPLALPATGDVFAGAAFPTYNPVGKLLDPLRFAPAPFSLAFAPPALEPGAPDAPAWPSGVAAKLPRRLPAGGFGGAATTGRRFNAMTRPRDPAEPEAESDGGGATTCGAMPARTEPDDLPEDTARCSLTANCGAGAITALRPIFSSPIGRADVSATLGGGAMTAGCSA